MQIFTTFSDHVYCLSDACCNPRIRGRDEAGQGHHGSTGTRHLEYRIFPGSPGTPWPGRDWATRSKTPRIWRIRFFTSPSPSAMWTTGPTVGSPCTTPSCPRGFTMMPTSTVTLSKPAVCRATWFLKKRWKSSTSNHWRFQARRSQKGL